jgi:hypothetical protein
MDSVEAVLAGLREQREKLALELARVERAIAALEGSLDGSAVPAAAAAAVASPARPYESLTLYEATVHYLRTVNEPRTSRQIAEALHAGGFRTRAQRFPSIVATMLGREDAARYFGIRRTRDKKRWFCSPGATS